MPCYTYKQFRPILNMPRQLFSKKDKLGHWNSPSLQFAFWQWWWKVWKWNGGQYFPEDSDLCCSFWFDSCIVIKVNNVFKILTVNVMTKQRTDRLTSLFKILISILSFWFQTQSSSPKKSAKRPPPPSSSSSDLSSSDSSSESDDGKTGSQKVVLYCLILLTTRSRYTV